PDKHVISCLVTNLSVNIDKLISLMKKEFRIMASFHPSLATKEAFMQGLVNLKAAGFKNITVNFVAYPEYLKDIPALKKFFEQEIGLYFRIDTFKDPDYKYSRQELELIREYKKKGFIAPDRTEGYSFEDFSAKACQAGKNLFIIIANGNVYSCMEGYYYSECQPYKNKHNKIDKFYLGNVFDGSFNASEKNRVCHSPCAELCDLELAGVRRISVSS
ncbi:MAG: hypothetical protein Q8R31_01065, partial [Candidatus Omnitrophota bacterium]|nr:hypothetical protein [Candidatus Omnitrophota bacterium]